MTATSSATRISPRLARIAELARQALEMVLTLSQRVRDVGHVASSRPDEPDAVVPHVRICGSPGGAIPRGHPAVRLGVIGRGDRFG